MRNVAVRLVAGLLARRSPERSVTSLAEARTVLVLKTDAIGDYLLAMPFLRELRAAAPRARITLVTTAAPAALAAATRSINAHHILELDDRPLRFGSLRRVHRYRRFLDRSLPKERFDYAFIPRTGPDTADAQLLARLSGAPTRLGFAQEGSDNWLTHALPRPPATVHEVVANMSLLHACGVTPRAEPEPVGCSPEEQAALDKRMAVEGIGAQDSILVLGVGASLEPKIWPAGRFVELAQIAQRNLGAHVVALGDATDARRLPPTEARWHNWCGQLSLHQSWALLARARLLVGNDSAGVHLAAAAGCPVVVVSWQPTQLADGDVNSYGRFSPYGVPYRIVHPTTEAGVGAAGVSVTAVREAADELWRVEGERRGS